MTDTTQTTNTPATEVAAPATPAPDTPEYVALMAARADQGTVTPDLTKTTPTPADPNAAPANVEKPEVDPNAPTPKLTDEPPKTGEETPKEPEKKEETETEVPGYDFKKGFEDGSVVEAFNAEKTDPALLNTLAKALGIQPEQAQSMVDQFKMGQQALVAQSEAKLFEAAGGKAEFNAIIAWGQKNLPADQKAFYEGLLNGPDAESAVQILKQKMAAGSDPSLVNANGARPGGQVSAFRDQAEMVAAMQDPRYQQSEAYRQEVANRLRVSQFRM
jgi:hypothetical protein